ncbi:MAG: hypothetical protein C0490_25495, partial [Marivirga sp.]|nr:hypothetical protein [Marivirga sp.]
GFLWRDLTTMILLSTSTEYESAGLFMDHFSKNFVEKLRWPYMEVANVPVRKVTVAERREPVTGESSVNIPTVIKLEPISDVKVMERKTVTPANRNVRSTSLAATESYVMEMPSDFERIKGADYIEYSSVGFYHNAAIIHPTYQAEMESLAAHMKADPNITLRVHGHCNGDATRTIIAAGIMTKFFEISNQDQQKTATAKEFTELRASYAKRYLISQGIHPERIQIVGEAAEKMIYPPTSEHAHYNDRVELEIVRSINN